MKDRTWMNPDWRRILYAAVVAVMVMLGLISGFAWMLGAEILDMEWMSLCAAAVILTGGFVGGAVAGGGDRTVLNSTLTGLCLWLMMFCINGAVFGFDIRGPLQCLLLIAGGVGASLLVRNRYSGSYKRRRKKRPRR